jgi:hypothetical protein
MQLSHIYGRSAVSAIQFLPSSTLSPSEKKGIMFSPKKVDSGDVPNFE